MRIERLHFQNYRLLRDATLPLEPLTLLVGANGSGKSTVLEALQHVAANRADLFAEARTLGVPWTPHDPVRLEVVARNGFALVSRAWAVQGPPLPNQSTHFSGAFDALSSLPSADPALPEFVRSFRAYNLVAGRIAAPTSLAPGMHLEPDGSNLAGALDQLRDRDPERWLELNDALPTWIPEFDQVLFETPDKGQRRVVLRTHHGRNRIPAQLLSAGTRLVLGLLAITYSETQTTFLGIEEPETGIHPRLLRNVYDALVRMAYPDPRTGGPAPRQVIVTTHSPYLLDLFRDHPESVVVAERHYGANPVDDVTFTRLSDHHDIAEIVTAGPLGEAWYTGVLGGVPTLPGPHPVMPAGPAGA